MDEWEPVAIDKPPAPGYYWELEFPAGDWRGGVIYWVRKIKEE